MERVKCDVGSSARVRCQASTKYSGHKPPGDLPGVLCNKEIGCSERPEIYQVNKIVIAERLPWSIPPRLTLLHNI